MLCRYPQLEGNLFDERARSSPGPQRGRRRRETAEELAKLRAVKCELAQGYHISPRYP
jgi:hypothetical protein